MPCGFFLPQGTIETDLQNDLLPILNKAYYGLFTQVDEDRVCFMEGVEEKPRRRNTTIYEGDYITMTLRVRDGFVRLNFKELHLDEKFDKDLFAESVKKEIGKAFDALRKKWGFYLR